MSYLVLARKYRPRSFEALVGQEHVVQALANALTQQRLHHAYLFTGTRGVGKTTVSRIMAKSLNCTGADGTGGITARPCGVCSACRDIDSGRFVDYVELDAASNRGVEEISQLLDQSVYKPVVGRFKVYMIDEVHMLSSHAFNAMLKTLEEPPEYLKFILATTDPQKLPPTVLSRCLQFNLRPMAPQTVMEHLGAVLGQEGIPADTGSLRLLSRAARGSMRDALSLTDQAIAFGSGELVEAGVRQMLGAVDRTHAVRILEALAAADGAALVAVSDGLRALGLSSAGTLEEMAAMLQQMAVARVVPDALDEADPDTPAVRRLASVFEADEIQFIYSVALHGREELALAPDEYSGLVMVLLRMLAFMPAERGKGAPAAKASGPASLPGVAVPEPSSARARPSQPVSAAPAVVPAQSPMPAAVQAAPTARVRPPQMPEPPPWLDAPMEGEAPPQIEPASTPAIAAAAVFERTAVGDRWAEVVKQMSESGAIGAMVRELALQSQCLSVEDESDVQVWRIRVERETLRGSVSCDKLQAALRHALGKPVRLDTESGPTADTPARRDAQARATRQREAEQIIESDPLVQTLMQQYKSARIVPGSVKPH